jgi:hypothetical protein
MKSLSEFCVEKTGVVVLDEKRKKKMVEEMGEKSSGEWGDEKCAGMVSFVLLDSIFYFICQLGTSQHVFCKCNVFV